VGGKGSGNKGKPHVTGYRQKMRDITLLPEVLEGIVARAKLDPEFALKCAEHGFGRAPQALDIRAANVDPGQQLAYRASLEGGYAIPSEATGIPTADDVLQIEGGSDSLGAAAGEDDDAGDVVAGGSVE
jgi:hypothetical protein